MNRREFWIKYAHEYGVSQEKAEQICKSVFNLLAETIVVEDRLYVSGLGTFKKKKLKGRRMRDVNTGEIIEIPEKEKIVFEMTKHN